MLPVIRFFFNEFKRSSGQNSSYCLYLADSNEPVGIAHFCTFPRYEDLGYCGGVGVRPCFQKRGFGKEIIHFVYSQMKAERVKAFIAFADRGTSLPIFVKTGARELFEHRIYGWP